MVSSDFNRFMDDYIEKRRESPAVLLSQKQGSKREEEESVPDDVSSSSVYIIKKPRTFFQRLLDKITFKDEENFEAKERVEEEHTIDEEQEFEQEYDEIKYDEKKLSFFQRIAKFFSVPVEQEYQDIDDEEKTEQNKGSSKKNGFFSGVLEFLGVSVEHGSKTENVQEEEVEEKKDPSMEKMIEIKQDLKDLALISVATFKRLPKNQFELFKNSDDFKKFKEILKKHNVVR